MSMDHPSTPMALGNGSARDLIPQKTISHTVGASEIKPLALGVFHTESSDQSLSITYWDDTTVTIPNVPAFYEVKGVIKKVTAATSATTVYIWV